MPQTIKIPGVGTVQTKYAIAGGAIIVGIAGFAWWRHLNAAPVTEEAAPAAADFTEGGDYVYGDSGMSAYATDYAYDGGAYPYPSYTTPSYGTTTTVQTATPVTNPEWTTRAIEHLELVGVESQTASLAVSRYLLKECVTATQADVVRQAIGGLGPPPQGTFSIVVCPTGTSGTGTTAPASGWPAGKSLPAPSGLRVRNKGATWVELDWAQVKNAIGYAVYVVEDPVGGSTPTGIRQRGSALYDNYTAKGLRPGKRYRFDIHPIGHDNQIGARGRIYATTTKK